ncbi:hypothetical protein BDA96_07G097900 [Sorghum bicolor]|uniref:Uncharacterized protein n=1 Tax=Sorghum bicolor TaxID=4558 RepID=A0A921UA10_SORBI|nr:hypothetical protein BDA96_07G097900 [Sorghum bicolor]
MCFLLKENDVSLVNLYVVARSLCWEKQSWTGLKMFYNLGCAAPFLNLNIGMIANRMFRQNSVSDNIFITTPEGLLQLKLRVSSGPAQDLANPAAAAPSHGSRCSDW